MLRRYERVRVGASPDAGDETLIRKDPPAPLLVTGIAALVVGATLALVWASAESSVLDDPVAAAVVRGLLVPSWALVGLVTWDRRPESPLGPLIMAAAASYALGGLTALESPGPFTLGALAWPVQLLLVAAVVVTFPDGRLRTRGARLVLVVLGATSAVFWGLLLVGAESVPTAAGPHRCSTDCPANPFALASFSASTVDAIERVALITLAAGIAAVAGVVIADWRASSPARRRALRPATVVLLCLVGSFIVAAVLRAALGEDDQVAEASFWVPSAVGAAFPLALLMVQSRERLFAPGAMRDMVARLTPGTTRRDLQATMAEALGDPSLRLVFAVPPAGHVGVDGTLVDVSEPGRRLTEIRDGDRLVAGILHDPILEQPLPGVVESAGAAVLLALENARLEAEVRTAARELRESRARILAAGMSERRRLERDLHDTAQQRLVMLRLKLGLAEQEAGNGTGAALLGRLGGDVEETVEALRRVGRGLYPPLLGEHGLAAALRAELRDDDRAELQLGDVGRSRPELEMAVYLSCRDALDVLGSENGGRDVVTLQIEARREWLRVNLHGAGRDEPGALAEHVAAKMRDAVSALGGRADATASDTGPWSVTAYVPWPRR